jgi:signal transduction histidine kinase
VTYPRNLSVSDQTGGVVAEREDSLVRGLLSGVAVFRWLAWTWMVVVLVVSRPELQKPDARPWVAFVLTGVALAVTALATVYLRREVWSLLRPGFIALEVGVGFALAAGDEVVYNGVPHAQMLASVWPLAGIITAGIAFAGRGGLIAGAIVGLGHLTGDLLEPDFVWGRQDLVSPISSVVLYALAGGIAGLVTVRLREAERLISKAQAREEIARTLHDGVLQTLAVVQRRAAEPDLVRLAHEQERELREYLFGSPTTISGGGEVGSRLRAAAAKFEDRYGGKARVVLAPDLPPVDPVVADALIGAIGEALTNAGKHGSATTVTVFAEPTDDTLFCSVKDDGVGFDPATAAEGVGLSRSIRDRIAEVGGRVEIDGNPGRGAEVRCWVPA